MSRSPYFPRRAGCLLALFLGLSADISSALQVSAADRSSRVSKLTYHGWADSLRLTNQQAEVVIVPAIGRVMQFKFSADPEGPFFENRALDGKPADPKSTDWANLGGDKTWPSPQADWPKVAGRGWPPPPAFDSMPVTATIEGDAVRLVNAVEPRYGIRASRLIRLDPQEAVMKISTTYEKVSGEPIWTGVWVITQLRDPLAVFLPVPKDSQYPVGYNRQSDELPLSLHREGHLLSMRRHAQSSHKIGNDAGSILWVGPKVMVRIDSPRVAGAEYPDQGSSAEVYTNPDPLAYVELELLGPLSLMKLGDRIERSSTYTLLRRTAASPAEEAARVYPAP